MAAVSDNGVIGKDNDLVWHLPADLKHFKKTTNGHYVIMGRKTYESLGKPLPGRVNIVISRRTDYYIEGAVVLRSLDAALEFAEGQRQQLVFILGGGTVYKQAMDQSDEMYITEVHGSFEGDTYFPEISDAQWAENERTDYPADEENSHAYSFVHYLKIAQPSV
jgi:dihydrofolate reductase